MASIDGHRTPELRDRTEVYGDEMGQKPLESAVNIQPNKKVPYEGGNCLQRTFKPPGKLHVEIMTSSSLTFITSE